MKNIQTNMYILVNGFTYTILYFLLIVCYVLLPCSCDVLLINLFFLKNKIPLYKKPRGSSMKLLNTE